MNLRNGCLPLQPSHRRGLHGDALALVVLGPDIEAREALAAVAPVIARGAP
eukprot:CAMPEP_0204071072 /NCGR_PEP_ID=MMETSP0360-20130528/159493_1 /ASSEMBLY_ACC=CAM_ASM_000342 /TAXON_ID=268821 /ORGANISM="Scrippsiella Hangoei, Strain SHTV-5" /LENGTH=50 /DNA_ID=CAMNT_0051019331 /DNA_START=142 /DNA_END=290 /DNA_ORIENTATION=-